MVLSVLKPRFNTLKMQTENTLKTLFLVPLRTDSKVRLK